MVLRLLQYPIPEEIRCFLWSEFLSVRDSYVIGYYSIIRNKQYGIPANSLSVIEADLRRMEISSAEHRQMLRLLVDSRCTRSPIDFDLSPRFTDGIRAGHAFLRVHSSQDFLGGRSVLRFYPRSTLRNRLRRRSSSFCHPNTMTFFSKASIQTSFPSQLF